MKNNETSANIKQQKSVLFGHKTVNSQVNGLGSDFVKKKQAPQAVIIESSSQADCLDQSQDTVHITEVDQNDAAVAFKYFDVKAPTYVKPKYV